MQIKDLVNVGKAKIKDAKARYLPKNYYEAYARLRAQFRGLDPSCEEYADAIDSLWLLSRQDVQFRKKRIEMIKGIYQSYQRGEIGDKIDPNASLIVSNLISLESQLERFKKREEVAGLFRDKYYSWRRKEISYDDFVSFRKSLLGGLRNAD